MILPGLDAERSFGAAERLRTALEKHRYVFEARASRSPRSLGVAIWPGDRREPSRCWRPPTARSTPPSKPAATA